MAIEYETGRLVADGFQKLAQLDSEDLQNLGLDPDEIYTFVNHKYHGVATNSGMTEQEFTEYASRGVNAARNSKHDS